MARTRPSPLRYVALAAAALTASLLAAGLGAPQAGAADHASASASASASAAAAAAAAARAATASAAGQENAAAPDPHRPPAGTPRLAEKPYLGWSSWSLQSTNYPGVNPDGPGSWLTEEHVLEQADLLAAKLKKHGYTYVNLDAHWWGGYDGYARPQANPETFPDGIAHVARHVHAKGLKLGIYLAVGLDITAYNHGRTPVHGAPGCHTSDLVYPDLRTTNGWDNSYKIDYASPCAQAYADSIAEQFAGWGVDFLKLDGVGPGSAKGGGETADHYDNRADVAAWRTALDRTGRDIEFTVSWSLSHRYAGTWKKYSNGWRIDTDVECYCDTLVTWDASVKQRWHDVVQWIDDAGPGHWNNLDSLDVGSGAMDGLTRAERQSYTTLWAIEAAPLYAGDDLTRLDPYGLSLLTNDEVLAVDQAGRPARPVDQSSDRQTWYARNADGSYTVALFNLGALAARVTADWQDLGLAGAARVRDLWSHRELGPRDDGFTAELPAHGSRLLRVAPRPGAAPAGPTQVHAAAATGTRVSLAWSPSAPSTARHGARVDHYEIFDGGHKAAAVHGTTATLGGLDPASSHRFTVRAVDTRGRASVSGTPVDVTTPGSREPVVHEAEDPANELAGGAVVGDCAACSGGSKAGNLGGSGTLAFTGVRAPRDGTYLVDVAYVDGDTGRLGQVTVHGETVSLPFPGTGDNDWGTPQTVTVPLHLKAGANTLRFAAPGGSLADIDKITL